MQINPKFATDVVLHTGVLLIVQPVQSPADHCVHLNVRETSPSLESPSLTRHSESERRETRIPPVYSSHLVQGTGSPSTIHRSRPWFLLRWVTWLQHPALMEQRDGVETGSIFTREQVERGVKQRLSPRERMVTYGGRSERSRVCSLALLRDISLSNTPLTGPTTDSKPCILNVKALCGWLYRCCS